MIYAHFKAPPHIDRLDGLWEEFQSAHIAVLALHEALERATRFERKAIARALREAVDARERLAFELIDAVEADINRLEHAA